MRRAFFRLHLIRLPLFNAKGMAWKDHYWKEAIPDTTTYPIGYLRTFLLLYLKITTIDLRSIDRSLIATAEPLECEHLTFEE